MDGAWVEYDLGPITIGVGCHPAWKPSRDGTTIAFEVDDIHSARAELINRGVEAVTEIEGGPQSRQYWDYFKDAEGNLFELVERLS